MVGSVSTLHKSLPVLSHLLSFKVYGIPPFYVGRLRPDPKRPRGTGGISSCSFLNSYSMCGTKPWEVSVAF